GPLQLRQIARLTAPPASTPLQESYFPPDQSVQQNLPPAGPPSESARFPLAPRSPFSITRLLGCGSPFQVRYVSGGLLFLKPLGTSPNMPSQWFFVNRFFGRRRTFPQVICTMFLTSYTN